MNDRFTMSTEDSNNDGVGVPESDQESGSKCKEMKETEQPPSKRRHTEDDSETDKNSLSEDKVKKEEPEVKKEQKEVVEDKDKSEEVEAVLIKLSNVFRSCVKSNSGENGSSTSFSAKKYCSACCAGARMLMKGIGTETHHKSWFNVLESAAISFHEGCPFPDSLADLLKSATTGEGYAAIEGSWFGLVETLEASKLLKSDEKGVDASSKTSPNDGWNRMCES